MNVTYYANDMQEALEKIKNELGPDAIIVSSKQVKPKGVKGAFAKKVYEVVANYEPENKPEPQKMPLQGANLAYAELIKPEKVILPNLSAYDYVAKSVMGDQQKIAKKPEPKLEPRLEPKLQPKLESAERMPKFEPKFDLTKPLEVEKLKTFETKVYEPKKIERPEFEPYSPYNVKPNVPKYDQMEVTPGTEKLNIIPKEEEKEEFKPLLPTAPPVEEEKPSRNILDVPAEVFEPKKMSSDERLDALDSRITELQDMLNRFSEKFEYIKKDITYDYSSKVQSILEKLIQNEVPEPLAHEICQEVEKVLKKKPDSEPKEVASHMILDILGEVKTIQYKKFEQRVIMLVGPTGVGKTTTLVKLVSQIVCNDKLKVGIINSDVYRVGAQEQLKNYIEILKIPMKTIYELSDIHEALEEFENMDFVFIDTAGKLSNDEEYIEDIRLLIKEAKVDEIYLAIGATTSMKAANAIIDNYQFLGNYRLLVTKVDESGHKGQIINFARRSGRPLSYFTVGQSVPDDIVKADVREIVKDVLR